MKGHVMILLVNAAIFGVAAFATLGYGLLLHRSANTCVDTGGADCARTRDAANTTYRVAPFLFAVGVILATIGWWNHTKPAPRDEPPAQVRQPPPPQG